MRLNERLNMANLRERALRALGIEGFPSDAELIGMLLLELRSLTRDNFGPLYSAVAEPPDEILEALVLAVEAEKEGK